MGAGRGIGTRKFITHFIDTEMIKQFIDTEAYGGA